MPLRPHREPLPRRGPLQPWNASPRLARYRRARQRPPREGSVQPSNARARRGNGQDPLANPAARLPFSHPDSDRRRRTTARRESEPSPAQPPRRLAGSPAGTQDDPVRLTAGAGIPPAPESYAASYTTEGPRQQGKVSACHEVTTRPVRLR